MKVIEARLSNSELAAFTRDMALELDEADYSEMCDETGAPFQERSTRTTILLHERGVESDDFTGYGEHVTMPCKDIETPWRLFALHDVPQKGIYYNPCDGVRVYFSWRAIHQAWLVQLKNEGNSDAHRRLAKVLASVKTS